MKLILQMARETITALAVLALVLLSYGAQAGPGSDHMSVIKGKSTLASFCGDDGSSDTSAHSACHACRSTPIALPPPPCVAEPAYVQLATVRFADVVKTPVVEPFAPVASPRAPPRA